jgi:hypothetical protein
LNAGFFGNLPMSSSASCKVAVTFGLTALSKPRWLSLIVSRRFGAADQARAWHAARHSPDHGGACPSLSKWRSKPRRARLIRTHLGTCRRLLVKRCVRLGEVELKGARLLALVSASMPQRRGSVMPLGKALRRYWPGGRVGNCPGSSREGPSRCARPCAGCAGHAADLPRGESGPPGASWRARPLYARAKKHAVGKERADG